jgi:vacuolar-type H+-ATPase subunit H
VSAATPDPHAAPPAAPASIEVLKRVKAAENEWAAKIEAARKEASASLDRARNEFDESIRAAIAASETERARALERARGQVDQEVAQIDEDGERAAEAAARTTGKRPQDQRERVLTAVLGSFAEP